MRTRLHNFDVKLGDLIEVYADLTLNVKSRVGLVIYETPYRRASIDYTLLTADRSIIVCNSYYSGHVISRFSDVL